ncbi:MAG TPA: histidine kinase [Pyrinomonadaceae bacterium]
MLGLTFACLSYAMAVSDGRQPSPWLTLSTNLTRVYIWAALSPLIYRFTARFPLGPRPFSARNVALQVPAAALFCLVHQALYAPALWWLNPALGRQHVSLAAFYKSSILGSLFFNILVYALIVISIHAVLYYRNFRAGELREADLKAQIARAELHALKMQLQPHFLFNTLHSISALVLEDPDGANRMIARLGDFLRLTLERPEQQTVALEEELEFLRRYLEIEQVRFHDRLTVRFDVEPSTLGAQVPHLILQPVIENAIRHGVAPRAAPGHVEVTARRVDGTLRLSVRDDGPGLGPEGWRGESAGVGLLNVRSRLARLYGSAYDFQVADAPGGGVAVLLAIPFEPETPARVPDGQTDE